MESLVRPLQASVDRLHELVRGLEVAQLESPSYSSGWTIADVLSHLGSSAVMLRQRLRDARAGVETTLNAQPIWDERFEKLDALLADIQGAPKEPSRAKRSAEHKERRNERGDDDG